MTDSYNTGVPAATGSGTTPPPPSTGTPASGSGMTEKASELGHEAAHSGQHVAGVAKDEAGRVASEVGSQARQLLHQARGELTDQAATQQERVAEGLRSMSDQLRRMGDRSPESGMAQDLDRQAADRTGSIADWLSAREPGSLVEEVKSFARQRPGVFIAVAVGAGVLAGRLTRSMMGGGDSGSAGGMNRTTTQRMPASTMPTTQGTSPVSATGVPRTGVDPDLVPPTPTTRPVGGGLGGVG